MAASATYGNPAMGTVLGIHSNSLFEHVINWQDGATAGTIPDLELPDNSITGGHITAIGFKPGATAPNTITVTIKDGHDIPIYTGTLTAIGRFNLPTGSIPFVGPLTVSHSGNTTVNANGTTYVLVF